MDRSNHHQKLSYIFTVAFFTEDNMHTEAGYVYSDQNAWHDTWHYKNDSPTLCVRRPLTHLQVSVRRDAAPIPSFTPGRF